MDVRIRPARAADLGEIVSRYKPYVERSPATFETVPVCLSDRVGWPDDHRRGGAHRLLVAESDRAGLLGWATTSSFRPRAAYATTVESSVYCCAGFTG